jgi:uncharacterized phage-associated protein
MAMNDIVNNSGVTGPQEYRPVDDIIINHDMPATGTSNCDQQMTAYRPGDGLPLQIKADLDPVNVVSVFDVAQYVLSKLEEPCTTMKLHKLLYYCQAWYLVWEDKPLFKENIEAWANGPVVRALFNYHQGMYWATPEQLTLGNPSKLNDIQRDDINNVLAFYGNKSSQWLINQTHIESPWLNARKGLLPSERGNRIIPLEAISEYYSSLR